MKKTTTIINLFGGPGAGKTTCAWEIAAELKKRGFVTEYVSEYAKELVWNGEHEKLDGSLQNQTMLYEEQKHRIDRLIGKVDFIVTDSPTLLSISYLKERNPEFEERISEEFKANNNFCMIVQRGNVFETEGRVHNLEQSKQLDEDIQNLLVNEEIPFGIYRHHTIEVSIENMIRVHWGHEQSAKYELFNDACEYYKNSCDIDSLGTIDRDFLVQHIDELIYCYENKKDLIDFDFWVQYENLLDEKITWDEYAAIDSQFDGDPHDIEKNETDIISEFQNKLKEYRSFCSVTQEAPDKKSYAAEIKKSLSSQIETAAVRSSEASASKNKDKECER